MVLEEITAAIKGLSVEERRKVALYILELEKAHIKETIGPQIAEDLESVSRVIQNAAERIRQHVKDKL
jgi:VIT1/CCC1 family predicted Fe2+/Mn2+ transporter